jgi:hypothetical protein
MSVLCDLIRNKLTPYVLVINNTSATVNLKNYSKVGISDLLQVTFPLFALKYHSIRQLAFQRKTKGCLL